MHLGHNRGNWAGSCTWAASPCTRTLVPAKPATCLRPITSLFEPTLLGESAPLCHLVQAGKNVSDFSWSVSTAMFAHPTTTPLNIVGYFMGPFVFATNMFSFVMLVSHRHVILCHASESLACHPLSCWCHWHVALGHAVSRWDVTLHHAGESLTCHPLSCGKSLACHPLSCGESLACHPLSCQREYEQAQGAARYRQQPFPATLASCLALTPPPAHDTPTHTHPNLQHPNTPSPPLQLSAVVTEKEAGLRQALRTMGMLESAFWLSWMAVEVVSAVIFTLVLIGFGAAFQFNFFLLNNFWLVGGGGCQGRCSD